jgi:hypothetical protein
MRIRLTTIGVALLLALCATASAEAAVTVSDVGTLTGLGKASSKSWSSAPYDFNGDGRQDVLIVYHDQGATLWRNDGGHFTAVQNLPAQAIWPNGLIGQVDRHGCAWGDVNSDGRPDIYCTVGRTGFNLIKPADLDNELWLQGADGTFRDVGSQWGVGDPYGRGRSAAFIDANGDGWPDLYVANETPRPNDPDRATLGGNRLFLNTGGTGFAPDTTNAFHLNAFIGNGKRVIIFDYNRDGWQDLLVAGAARPYLYVNNAGHGFTEIGANVGLTTPYQDIAIGDVTGDGKADLIGLTADAVILRWRTPSGFSAPVTLASFSGGGGQSIALGDANGDGRLDIYAVRSGATADLPDMLLLNQGGPWMRITIPATTGTGTDVTTLRALPAKDDFLVLNGMPNPGTIQVMRTTTTTPAPTRFITYMFGRAQVGSYIGGSGCTVPLPGNVPLWTVADLIRAHGHTATAPVTLNQTGSTAPVCQGTIRYATWADLTRLQTQYGWSVASRGRTGRELTTLTPAEQQDETCGTLPDFTAHGFPDTWGMFAYPNNTLTAALQTSLVTTCYGFGRRYSVGVNKVPVPPPYWALTNSVNGGRCTNPALACYTMTVKNNRRYTSPQTLIGYENSTGWTIIQWYRFVTGRAGTITAKTPSWDCTSPNTGDHWTNEPELYCYDDAHLVIDSLAPGAMDASPAIMAHRQGRLGR